MILTLLRYWSDSKTTLGKLFIDGQFECYTLEDAAHTKKIKGETRIPSGTYQVRLRFSPHFSEKYGHDMLWLKDVPGFQYILIHKGNTNKDTAGCILVGSSVQNATLIQSSLAYKTFYSKVSASAENGSLSINIINHDQEAKNGST